MTYSSLNQLLYPHPDTRVKSNGELRDGVETLWSNLDQQAEMKKGIIICNVRQTYASTLYAAVVLLSRTALCSIVPSKSISVNTCIPNSKACSYTFVMRARHPVKHPEGRWPAVRPTEVPPNQHVLYVKSLIPNWNTHLNHVKDEPIVVKCLSSTFVFFFNK